MRQPFGLTFRLARYLIGKKFSRDSRYPIVMMMEPLHTCNLACLGCTPDRWAGPKSEWLSVEQCLESVDECGAPMVSVCGGEPLVHTDIDRIIGGILDRDKYCIICTNALLLPKFLEKRPADPKLSFAIHLDGGETTHDYVTQRPGCFKKAIEASKLAIEKGHRVNANCTVFAETDIDDLSELFRYLMTEVGFHGILVSPGYDFDQTGKDFFLRRQQVNERFRKLLSSVKEDWFGNSQLYLDFLKGEQELTCTAWGNPTRTPKGWQGPCYMLRDAYYPTFRELVDITPWHKYGPESDEPRCKSCMVHAGFEPTVASGRNLSLGRQLYNAFKMLK
jgi:hopanoid biosynthesis associated radical SAM protein HpnH